MAAVRAGLRFCIEVGRRHAVIVLLYLRMKMEIACTDDGAHALAPAQAATRLVKAVESGMGEKPNSEGAGNLGGGKHMSNNQDTQRSEADAELEREIRKGRKFTLAEAIGRLAGPGAMKGESPIARMQQAQIEIEFWLRSHLADAGGALQIVLDRHVKGSELLLNNFDQPLVVLASYCQ